MEFSIKVINGTDREIRFQVLIRGESTGDLMMGREDFTKFADKMFGRNYTLTPNGTTLPEPTESA